MNFNIFFTGRLESIHFTHDFFNLFDKAVKFSTSSSGKLFNLFLPFTGSSQFSRHPFTPALHPWGFSTEHKGFDSYTGWVSNPLTTGNSRVMDPPSPVNNNNTNPLYQSHTGGIENDSLSPTGTGVNFPNVSNNSHTSKDIHSPEPTTRPTTGSCPSEAGSCTEYSPDSKPVKFESMHLSTHHDVTQTHQLTASPGLLTSGGSSASYNLSSAGSGGQGGHPLSSYTYMSGSDYGSALFHPANMFKAATLARVSKKRTSTGGEGLTLFILSYIFLFFSKKRRKLMSTF